MHAFSLLLFSFFILPALSPLSLFSFKKKKRTRARSLQESNAPQNTMGAYKVRVRSFNSRRAYEHAARWRPPRGGGRGAMRMMAALCCSLFLIERERSSPPSSSLLPRVSSPPFALSARRRQTRARPRRWMARSAAVEGAREEREIEQSSSRRRRRRRRLLPDVDRSRQYPSSPLFAPSPQRPLLPSGPLQSP